MTTWAAIDVDYREQGAVVAAVVFESIDAATPAHEQVVVVTPVAPYEPGAFYKRELPCALAVLEALSAGGRHIGVVIVDGDVWLGPGVFGLGAHLWTERRRLHDNAVVIGVAKTPWHDRRAHVAVTRGGARPLWVTAAGCDVDTAAHAVAAMHGPFRLPTLLKHVDRLARTAPLSLSTTTP